MVCRLAKEYEIPQVRTQFEKPYIIPDLKKHLKLKYPINLAKLALLDIFTMFNEAKIHEYGLKTNDFLVGVTYTSMMDSLTVAYGAMAVKYDNATVEAVANGDVELPAATTLTVSNANKAHPHFGNIVFHKEGTYKFVVKEVK